MKSAHTPGPWHCVEDFDGGRRGRINVYSDDKAPTHSKVAIVLETYLTRGAMVGDPDPIAARDANAALISAAPTLLAWAEKSSHHINCSSFRVNVVGVVHRDGPCDCGRDSAIALARGGGK